MKKLLFIDALRGIAVLGVLICHTSGNMELWRVLGDHHLTPWVFRIAGNGARGVQLFFIVSAFTLCLSYERRRKEKNVLLNFFIRRFFRIAPLFYCGFLLYTVNPILFENKEIPSLLYIISTLTFTHSWHPYWISGTSTLVPGGWSIAVEMSFYLLFPFLFSQIRSLKQAIYATIGSLLVSRVIYFILNSHPLIDNQKQWQRFLFFWLPNQLPIFFIGFIFYFIFRKLRLSTVNFDEKQSVELRRGKFIIELLLAVSIILLAVIPFLHLLPVLKRLIPTLIPIHFAYGLDFLLLAICLSIYPSRLLVNRFFCFLGTISFSAYITHFYVLRLVNRALQGLHLNNILPELYLIILTGLTLAGTIIVSYLSYRLIEVPGQALGRKLILSLEAKKLAT
ncbi:MAG: acyltransferase [Desmonostoc vinosum HA7617-LM4]|jgi:peptidoglycan/LPS O-acetylase OafA/YrhL|nr:acyltransferase [Desmonostoc vinosum HA7617-LM4]